jgi:sulfur carrier protein ThiS adenylyltransferase
MKVYINERKVAVREGTKVAELVKKRRPEADLCVLNGFPCLLEHTLEEGDRLVLIKKGSKPSKRELEHLMAARHTPGVHAKLKKACVGIAGCGGLGSTAAMALARAGIGRLVIVDFDVVEPSNLNRQQYFVSQIGQPKVRALAENIRRANPFVKVEPRYQRVVAENVKSLFGRCRVIIEAFDRADQKEMLAEAVMSQLPETPLILGNGMAGWGGNNLLKTRRLGNLYICGDESTEAGPGRGLMAPRVGVAACLQANQALEILLGPDPAIGKASETGEGLPPHLPYLSRTPKKLRRS